MDEHEPVEDSEFVYRRIPGTFYDAGLPVPVQREAFRPNTNDTNGLSVFRACFAQPIDTLFNLDPTRAKNYYVAQISVRTLRDLLLKVGNLTERMQLAQEAGARRAVRRRGRCAAPRRGNRPWLRPREATRGRAPGCAA